jgi:hypothetical protein
MSTFNQASAQELLKRFPDEPWPTLEEPALREPLCRREFQEALERDDLLDDEQCRLQIRELMQVESWLDDVPRRRRIGQLLQQGKWGEPNRAYLQHCLGHLLQKVAWQQDEEYRKRTKELLAEADSDTLCPKPHSLGTLQGELGGFLQLLEASPTVAMSAPGSAQKRLGTGPNRIEERREAGGGEESGLRKCKGGRRPLEESNRLKLQVYERVKREHQLGGRYADTVERLKNDKDFVEQVKAADLEKVNAALVHKALAWFDIRRRRDQARNKQRTDES